MTITRRLSLGYTILLVIVLAISAVGIIWLVALNAGYKDFATSVRDEVSAAATINNESAKMTVYGVAAMTALDESSGTLYLSNLEASEAAATAAVDRVAALNADDAEDGAAVADIRTKMEELSQTIRSSINLSGSDMAVAQAMIAGSIMPIAREVDQATQAYLETEQSQQDAQIEQLSGRSGTLMLVMAVLVAVCVVITVVLAVRTTRHVRRKLKSAIAGIDSSAAQMMAVASQVAAGAAETAASTNETTATVEEVKQTALHAHEKAAQVSESSQEVARFAETGRGTVEETISGIDRMQNQMTVVAETIHRLSEQTQAVGEIITTVNDLAEQSNLLSVNASIEAAKAGEHGKGFTVVAQEVKSLAEQSKQAVTQVRVILNEIQKAGTTAVQAAEQGIEAVEAGRRQSLESGEVIQQLAQSATEAAQSAVQISASSRQQLAGMEQISQAIETINKATGQSVSGTRQVEDEVRELQKLASNLKLLIEANATA